MSKPSHQIALDWQAAVNGMDRQELLRLSNEDIEIVGPRGVARGHDILLQWIDRAGIQLEAGRVFAAEDRAVVEQHAVWTEANTHEESSQTVASSFTVHDGRVTRLARFDQLAEALADGGLSAADEVSPAAPAV